MDLLRLRRVLNQFDQMVSVHHLTGRDGHLLAWPERPSIGGWLMGERPQPIALQVLRATHQVRAAFLDGGMDGFRIGQQEIGRAEHVEPLSCREGQHVLVVPRDTRHIGLGVVPPLLRQQERLRHQ